MMAAQLVHFHMVVSPFRTLQVLPRLGLASWTQANSGITIQEEIKKGNETEIGTEKGTVIGTEIENVLEKEIENVITVQLLVYSTVMRSDIGTENMQTEAMNDIEQAEKRKNDTEKEDIEKKRKQGTSRHEVTVDVAMTVKKETATGGTNTKNRKRAKKEKKQVVENLPRNRKTLKLLLQNRHVWFLPTCFNYCQK